MSPIDFSGSFKQVKITNYEPILIDQGRGYLQRKIGLTVNPTFHIKQDLTANTVDYSITIPMKGTLVQNYTFGVEKEVESQINKGEFFTDLVEYIEDGKILQITRKEKSGKYVTVTKHELSEDGKTLTINITHTPKGKDPIEACRVLKKE